MSDITKVALDAMGGDNAPGEIVKGAVEAVGRRKDIKIFLTGKEDRLRKELSQYTYPKEQIEIVNATEVIETAEPPVKAIRGKKDSSIVVAMKMVKNGEADAFVSAGSTGAVLVGGQVLVGRIKGVERPPLAPLLPTLKGVSLLIDCKEEPDCRYREYRRGGGEGKCPCEGDIPSSQGMHGYQFYRQRGGERYPIRRGRCHRL